MDNSLVEGFKVVGSAAGIISGGFLVYDRFIRGRPQMYLAKADAHEVDVVFKNAANETLIVDEIGVEPNVLGLAYGHDIRGTVEAAYGRAVERKGEDGPERRRPCFFPVEPLGELKLGVIRWNDVFNQLKSDDRITIRLKWRNTRLPLPLARNVKVRTTAGDIRKLLGEDGEE